LFNKVLNIVWLLLHLSQLLEYFLMVIWI